MHRIDSADATPDHLFTAGDPTVPVDATTVTPDWLNSVQEEICAVIEDAGVPLDKAKRDQLLEAIREIAAVRLAPDGGIIETEAGLAVDPSVIDATAQLRYHGLI